ELTQLADMGCGHGVRVIGASYLSTAGGCDVAADIARRYPIPIICELLGAPRQDWRLFSAWTDDIFKILGPDVGRGEADIVRATGELRDYVEQMVACWRETLSDDLIST